MFWTRDYLWTISVISWTFECMESPQVVKREWRFPSFIYIVITLGKIIFGHYVFIWFRFSYWVFSLKIKCLGFTHIPNKSCCHLIVKVNVVCHLLCVSHLTCKHQYQCHVSKLQAIQWKKKKKKKIEKRTRYVHHVHLNLLIMNYNVKPLGWKYGYGY